MKKAHFHITAYARLSSLLPVFFFCACPVFSQQKISGFIKDIENLPVPGATIVIKNSKIGAYSMADGSFTIEAKPGDFLNISSVGMIGREVLIRDHARLIVIMSFAENNMEEVMVVGYGTSKRKDITGAISSVSHKNFNKGNFSSPDQLIQGKVSGVQITSNTGAPGGSFSVKVRGYSALIGTGQPLYVIDGVPLDGRSLQEGNNPLNFINTADVASIDILKDASATAIYGSRAAYGVVIINTKKGRAGAPKIEVAASVGVSSILKKVDVLNAAEYRDAIQYYGVDPSFDKGGDVDALNSILQNALQQNYSIAASGGNENGKYRFSAGYLNQEGIVINTGFKKYSADLTTSTKLLASKKLGLDFHINTSQYLQDGSSLASGNEGIIRTALGWNPTNPLRNMDGSLRISASDGINPVAISQYAKDNLKVTTVLGTITPYYKITDWLEYKLLVSVNYSSGFSRLSLHQALGAYSFAFPPGGSAGIRNNELTTGQVTQTLSLDKEVLPSLHLNAVVGYEYLKFTTKGFGQSGVGDSVGFGNYGIDYTNYIQYSNVSNRSISSYSGPQSELQSFFGRTMFNYKDEFLLTATLRADGSSKFGANNKYAYFPSFAFGWNISNEEFFKVDNVNTLKIRAGWGKTGNQEFPAGSSQALYAFQNGGTVIQINNPNPDLKWQSDRQYNFGLDFSIYDNWVTGTIDYFNKKTTNLLFPSAPIQPAPAGSVVRWINLPGGIVNQGWEILVNSVLIKKKEIDWNLSVNATFLQNNVSGLPAPVGAGFLAGPIEIIENGLPMYAFFTRKFLGLDKSTGYSVYQDDGATFHFVGNPNPKFLAGFSSIFRYNKFLLTANMYGSFGQDIYNFTLMNLNVNGIMGGNMARSVYKDPVKESFGNPVTPSSRYIHKGSFLKMANLTIAYNIRDLANDLKEVNVYVTAQNLFIITKYEGFDPEVNVDNRNRNGVAALGIDGMRYPSSRSFNVGINLTL